VVAVGAHDDVLTVPGAVLEPEAPGELGGRVDPVAAARAQEDLRAGHRRELREALRELARGRGDEVPERRVGLEPAELVGDRLGDLGAPVADVAVPEACGRVEVAVAVGVEDPDVLAALEHQLRVLDRTHVGEGVPQGAVAHSAQYFRV
jgi:hypothetical protein